MVAHLCLLLISIYAIVKSSDVLLSTAIGLGRKARLNDYFIGSFLIGIGTSLPELFTSIAAAYSGSPELVAPTVFGTVIANLGAGFGLGVLALFFFVRTESKWYPFTWSHALSDGYLDFRQINTGTVIFASFSVVLALLLCLDNQFGRFDASLFFILYIAFMGWEFYRSQQQQPDDVPPPRKPPYRSPKSPKNMQIVAILQIGLSAVALSLIFVPSLWHELREIATGGFAFYWFIIGLASLCAFQVWDYYPELTLKGGSESSNVAKLPPWIGILLLGFIIVVVYFSGETVVGSLVKLSEDVGINSGALAASALALGTSLPDIVVALNVVRRGRHELLVGHIFQSNVFDAFLIMAICGLITPLPDVATGPSRIAIIASIILTLPLLWTLRSRKLTAPGGLALFLGFLVFLFVLYG